MLERARRVAEPVPLVVTVSGPIGMVAVLEQAHRVDFQPPALQTELAEGVALSQDAASL